MQTEYSSQVGRSLDWDCVCGFCSVACAIGYTRNLPRFRMLLGSSARLTARIAARSVGDEPQTSKWDFASFGQRTTTAEASRGSVARNAEAALANCMADGGSTESGTNAIISAPIATLPIVGANRLLSSPAFSAATTAF